MTRIAIVIAGLSGGGAERAATALAGELAGRRADVALVTFSGDEPDFYGVADGVRRIRLGITPTSGGLWRRLRGELDLLRRLRRAVADLRPDAVIGFATETSVRAILAGLGTTIPVVAAERADPSQHDPGEPWVALRRHLYRFASVVVAQTTEARDWILAHTSARRVVVVPNSIALADAPSGNRVLPPSTIVGLGHFRPEKGFDQLVEAFARTRAAHPEWHLALIGDGPEEPRLRAAVARLGVEPHVIFVGRVKDPAPLLRQAQIFALPSHHEGFPNALLEAMACGLPAVCFDCSGGPRAIVREGVDGLLVPPGETGAFADALATLMADADRRQRYGAAARAVRERFSPDRVTDQWLALLGR